MLDRSRVDLDDVELPPFAAAIAAGSRAVMTGHLLVPSLDADNIATVSTAITTGLLRERLGFTGTVLTDALEMRALAGTLGIERGFVAALLAGADAIETGALDYPHLVDTVPAAVQRALDSGELTIERLRAAAERTAALATQAAPNKAPLLDGVAARCIEVIGALPSLTRPLVVEARPPGGMASGELPWSLAHPLASRVSGVVECSVEDATQVASATWQAAERTLVAVVRDPHRHTWQQSLVEAAASRPGSVIVDVGWPADLPAGAPLVRTRGVAPGLLDAAADVLAGRMRS